jgi:hypothetical protein
LRTFICEIERIQKGFTNIFEEGLLFRCHHSDGEAAMLVFISIKDKDVTKNWKRGRIQLLRGGGDIGVFGLIHSGAG